MKYQIGDKSFTQSKLKLGQIKQLLPYFDKISTALDIGKDVNIVDFVDNVKDDISDILAIVIVEENAKLVDRDIKLLSVFLDENLEYDTILDVVADFFTLTPIGLIVNQLAKITNSVARKTNKNKKAAG